MVSFRITKIWSTGMYQTTPKVMMLTHNGA